MNTAATAASDNPLLTPVRIGALELPNRVVMAPMTRSRAVEGNVPNPMAAAYYAQRASAGLIISEGSQVSPAGVGYPSTPGIHTDAQAAGWRQITDAVHGRGGRIFLQLWHVGRVSDPALQPNGVLPVAPSAIAIEGNIYTAAGPKPFVAPRALATDEIPGVIAEFANGAQRALNAGFDGVEIHGANGYLIDQFLRSGSNHRTDAYGGSVENRVRFLLELTEAVAAVWGADRVGIRFSPVNPNNSMSDRDPVATFSYAAQALNAFGLAYLHVIEPVGPSTARSIPGLHVAAAIRSAFHGPLMLNGGYSLETANSAIASGAADLVAFGVPYIANPDLTERFAEKAPLATAERATFYGGGAHGYTDYPMRDGSVSAAA